MNQNKSLFDQVFGVVARGQTYLNFLYLFLAFPLGLIYFIFLTVGLSLGIGTIIIWIGLAILALVIAGWWLMASFERVMAINMLKVDIPPMTTAKLEKATTTLDKLGAYLSNPVTWKGLAYLLIKFPLGTLSFVVLTTFTVTTVVLLSAPIVFPFFNPVVELWNTSIVVDTMAEASVGFVIGLALLFVSLHIFNGLAWVSGQFAKVMLGNPGSINQPPQPAVSTVPFTPAASASPMAPVEPYVPAEPEMPLENMVNESAAGVQTAAQE
ncbi:MAG TPA: sensor domain-containing protein [Bellilinea sp.]|nr:sensor domain-containing protein [Bellilinea sp.]